MVKRITKKVRERAIASLVSEVKIYDHYLTGEVYHFRIEGGEHNGESCGGFYGSDPFKNGISDYIPKELHDLLTETI